MLEAGALTATFLPDVGMTGVSLRYRGESTSPCPVGSPTCGPGGTGGLPLLAPWANRLASRRYRAAGVAVDLEGVCASRRRQRPADPRPAPRRRRAGGWTGSTQRGTQRPAAHVDRRRHPALPVPAPDRARRRRAGRRARGRHDRRSRPGGGGSRCRSAGTRTCGCPASPAAGGGCGSRRAGTSPLDGLGIPTGPRPPSRPRPRPIGRADVRRPVRARTRPPAGVRAPTTGSRSSSAAAAATPTPRSGCPRDRASPRSSRWWRRRTRSCRVGPARRPRRGLPGRFTLALT